MIEYVKMCPFSTNNQSCEERIVQIQDVIRDPFDVPRHRHLKNPYGPPKPVPILREAQKRLTKEELEMFNIPSCIS